MPPIWTPTPYAAPTIDLAAWVGHYPFRGIPGSSLADLSAKAAALRLSRLIVSPFDALFCEDNLDTYQRWLEPLAEYPAMEAWPVVNPAMPGQLARLAAAHDRHGFRGVRLLPSYHGYRLFDPRVAEVMDLARERGLIVQVFRRLVDDRYQWMLKVASLDVGEVMYLTSRWPGQAIVLSAFDLRDADLASSLAARLVRCPNVYADIAWLRGPNDAVRRLLDAGLEDRLVYGSLWPLHVLESTHWQVTQADVPEAARRKLLHDNARRLLEDAAQPAESAPLADASHEALG